MLREREAIGAPGSVVVANPLDEPMDPDVARPAAARRPARRRRKQGVRGRDVTPFLLERFHRLSEGESLRANVRLVLRNAALAAEIAAA